MASTGKYILGDDTFDEIVGVLPIILVDFYADWCQPCKVMEPGLDKVADTLEISVAKVDIEINPELVERFEVRSIPTVILFKDGEVAWRGLGAMPPAALMEAVSSHLT